MKERPVLFPDEIIHAILDGRVKTARWVVKVPKTVERIDGKPHWGPGQYSYTGNFFFYEWSSDIAVEHPLRCPYTIGDRLWVKEAFSLGDVPFEYDPGFRQSVEYRADSYGDHGSIWSRAAYMPRWASRITLEIVSVKIEQLRDISEDGAVAEGAPNYGTICMYCCRCGSHQYMNLCDCGGCLSLHKPLAWFKSFWNSKNSKKHGCSWDDNPWVWVVEFKRVNK